MRITIDRDVPVSVADGTTLATDIYRPDDSARHPAILIRTPYSKDAPALVNGWLNVLRAVEAGWAVAVQDVRGRFRSGGAFEPFVNEGPDGADTIGWIRDQVWSDGSVGMSGGSYGGVVQWLAAGEKPEGLIGIVPAVATDDVVGAFLSEGGNIQFGFVVSWVLGGLALVDAGHRPDAAQTISQIRAAAADALAGRITTIDQLPELVHEIAPYLRGWLAALDGDDYGRRLQRRSSTDDVPALIIGGLYDIFLRGTVASYAARHVAAPAGVADRLVLGPWAHGLVGGFYPERDFGPAASVDALDVTTMQLEWFDAIRAGGASGAPGVRVFVMGADAWHALDGWPSSDAVTRALRLTHDQRLVLDATEAAEQRSGVHVPNGDQPVPTVGGRTYLPGLFIGANSGPRDQRRAEGGVASFTADPLPRDTDVVGPASCALRIDPGGTAMIVAKLTVVDPAGRSELIAEGSARLEGSGLRLASIDLGAVAVRVPAGSRLRVNLSSSDFPRLEFRPGGDAVVETGPGSGSVLSITVLDPDVT